MQTTDSSLKALVDTEGFEGVLRELAEMAKVAAYDAVNEGQDVNKWVALVSAISTAAHKARVIESGK